MSSEGTSRMSLFQWSPSNVNKVARYIDKALISFEKTYSI